MKNSCPCHPTDLSNMARIEARLAASLRETADQVARTECFDSEQRAEVYAILDTIRADSEIHQKTIGCWVSDASPETTNV